MKKSSLVVLALAVANVLGVVQAAEQKTDKQVLSEEVAELENKCESTDKCDGNDVKKLEEKKSQLASLTDTFKFGIAIGFENYKTPYISKVETVGADRIVRITDRQNRKPGLWLETHYIWDGFATKHGLTHSAPGFYVGARILGEDADVFDAFGAGVMWSFKRTRIGNIPPAGQIAESINIGIGPVWHRTKVLAAGIVEEQPLPSTFTDPTLDSRDEVTWMIMISAGF